MSIHQQVHLIRHHLQRHHPLAVLTGLGADQFLTPGASTPAQHRAAVLRAPHDVISRAVGATCGNLHVPGHAGDYTHRLCQTTRLRRLKTAVPSRGA